MDNTAPISANPSDIQNADVSASLPAIKIAKAKARMDLASIFGLTLTFSFIVAAIVMGQSNASFFNVPSLLIVLLGTMTTTAVSFTGREIGNSGRIFAQALVRTVFSPSATAKTLVSLSVVSKTKGILALSSYDRELKKDKFLSRAIQMAVDGFQAEDIEAVLGQEIETLYNRHKRAAMMAKRASEIAPAMGLIGTLVGLVQMLADLENPETIGPAMAVALLTTFYGAILGTIVMAPLAVKLEKNSHDEALIKTLIKTAAVSIARQDNPRRLEMLLNSELPPSERIRYFD